MMTTTLTDVDDPSRETADVERSDSVKPQHDRVDNAADHVQGRFMHENSVGADAGRKRRLPEPQGHDRSFLNECFPMVDGQSSVSGLETLTFSIAVGDGTPEQTYMNADESKRCCKGMVLVSMFHSLLYK